MHKLCKRLLCVGAAALLAFTGVSFALGNYLCTLALMPQSNKDIVLSSPQNTPVVDPEGNATRQWREETPFEERSAQSFDGLPLHAYLFRQPGGSRKWLVAAHGYLGSGMQLAPLARRAEAMGFNTLLPDARACGKSGGEYMGMGWHDRLDLITWIDEILPEDPDAEIVLFGISMGGASVLMASGEVLPANVKAIVADCSYSSLQDEFAYQLRQLFGLPAFPILPFSSLAAKMRAGYFFSEGDVAAQVARCETPLLLIHGEDDSFVPSTMLDELCAASTVETERLLVQGAGHGQAAQVAGEAYWQTLESFLARHL